MKKIVTCVESIFLKMRRIIVDVHDVDVHLSDAWIYHDLSLLAVGIKTLGKMGIPGKYWNTNRK